MLLIKVLLFIISVEITLAFDSEQLEVFDIVDEVKENFYSVLNITKDATNQQIKTAFRSLSLKLHPDKNQDKDTSEEFRNLVSVYEVLRSPTKRKHYDDILVNGLPNWRSAVYYYRYVRKMGLIEVGIILFVIITIGQYLVNWASYLEMKYTLEQNKKKKSKKAEKDKTEPEILPKPSFLNTLPFQIPRLTWYIIVSLPKTVGFLRVVVAQQIEEVTKPPPVEEPPEPVRIKQVRKRNKGFVLPEGANFETTSNLKRSAEDLIASQPLSGGLWTDDDLSELIRLVKKYPGGSTSRWETIAEALNRPVPEVTYMAHKMKDNAYRLPAENEDTCQQPKIKQKTKKEFDSSEEVKKWSQPQQRALEDALAKYPKGCTDRWDRISECIPDKTKEECMLRFRYLAEILKKSKEAPEQVTETN